MALPAPLAPLTALALASSCMIALAGCQPSGAERESSQPASAAAPLPAPDLSPRNQIVQTQVRERLRWLERMRSHAELSAIQAGEVWGEVARLYHAYGFPDAAEAYYLRAQAAAPDDARWSYYLGQLYRSQNRLAESLASFEAARRLQPDDVPSLVRLGEVLLDLEHPDEARRHLERALELDAECAAAHFALGQHARLTGEPARAVAHLEQVLALQPEASAARHPLGLAYRELGQEERARELLTGAGSTPVSLVDPLTLELHARTDGMLRALQRGQQALAEQRLADAREALREAVASDPLFSLPRVQYSRALLLTGEPAAAREQLELALQAAPESADAHFNLGFQLERAGDARAALRHYRSGLEHDPDNVPGRLALGMLLLELGGQPVAAAAELARVVELDPSSRAAWIGRASALVEAGLCPEARQWLEQGLRALEGDAVLAHGLARLLAACPDPTVRDGARAFELASSLFDALPSPAHAEAVAMALAELGRFEEALAFQARALELARTQGNGGLVSLLEANLARFRAQQRSTIPWPRDGLRLFAPGPPRSAP